MPRSPGQEPWLDAEFTRIVEFARAARRDGGGFAWLDDEGVPTPDGVVHTWITARMTHVFALAHLRGLPDTAPLVDHGVAALSGLLRDAEHGGWFPAVDRDGRPLTSEKRAYDHAFVVLAASTAAVAARPGADELLGEALRILDLRFWSEGEGACVESWDRAWTTCEAYRGANSNMHAVECFLAAADATGDAVWRRRALRIAERVVHVYARRNSWRLIEHFDAMWRPLPDYNRTRPDDPFRPYGATIGHWFEWARLLVSLSASLPDSPAWLRDDAAALFAAAVREGWNADGSAGFVYTVDWDGRPVVSTRMHWVLAEAVLAAAALRQATGDPGYDALYRAWWTHADTHFLDRTRGSWHHELDTDGRPSATVWKGKPDAYHALQATLLPLLPVSPTAAETLRRRTAGRHSRMPTGLVVEGPGEAGP
ncbi:AGE family epimerase/isomerase [Yinghuangia seranimata]|uniref:AGE family epimerase/isomerase n=1 Tax=Yinghuangia seranimata TaxID=408067 RepID=UPI00248B9221|nr:AGE family epimerase/isomerase [Yinghuangia seranimata]MDI2129500.1 AGE family epimerase/isomerase [Yinghuangia seranimata]